MSPESTARAARTLEAGAGALGLALPPGAHERLLAYLAELRRWNRAYSLVADAPADAWARSHVLDSLSVAAPLRALVAGAGGSREPISPAAGAPGAPRSPAPAPAPVAAQAPPPPTPPGSPARPAPRVLDLGTGAGLPGIPLAVALPELRFVLLDANGKKARFCRHAASALGLSNVEVVKARAERYAPPAPFDAAVVRALGSLARIRDLVRPHCPGPILAMKGRHPASELAALGAAAAAETTALRVPGLGAERHLVVLR